jgi:hypothetical protein
MACKYDKTSGLAAFATNHLSRYVVGYDSWTNPFTDVKTGDWYTHAIAWSAESTLRIEISSLINLSKIY